MEDRSLAVIDAEVVEIAPTQTVEQFEARLIEFREFTKRNLRPDIDFGTIPYTDKPTLLKPGAEKLLRWYGLVVDIDLLPTSRTDITEGVIDLDLRGTVRHAASGRRLGTLHANANSEERKYKNARFPAWECRNWTGPKENRHRCGWKGNSEPAGMACPQCGSEKLKRPQTIADQKNTLLKMGDKRVWVAAALLYTGASEAYTQDMEDGAGGTSESSAVPTVADRDLCSDHRKQWTYKEGVYKEGHEKAGQPWAFWGCPHFSMVNGKREYCQKRPPKGYEGPQESSQDAPDEAPPADTPASDPNESQAGAGEATQPIPTRGSLLTTAQNEIGRLREITAQTMPEEAATRLAMFLSNHPQENEVKGITGLSDAVLEAYVAWLQHQKR